MLLRYVIPTPGAAPAPCRPHLPGYAFLEFRTHEAADMLLRSYNGQPIPGTDQVFRLNWAAYGVGKAQPAGEGAWGAACAGRARAAAGASPWAPAGTCAV